jgi:hypothetical protein
MTLDEVTMRYEVSTVISRPLPDVFRFVTNIENQPQWQAASVENHQLTPGPMAVGAQIQYIGKWLGRRYEGSTPANRGQEHQRATRA